MTLKELQIGKSAVVDTVGGTGALRQHFLDMGLVPHHVPYRKRVRRFLPAGAGR